MCDLKLTNGIGYQEDVEPVDLTVTHKGRLWDHKAEECRELLRSMSDLSAAMASLVFPVTLCMAALKSLMDRRSSLHSSAL